MAACDPQPSLPSFAPFFSDILGLRTVRASLELGDSLSKTSVSLWLTFAPIKTPNSVSSKREAGHTSFTSIENYFTTIEIKLLKESSDGDLSASNP